MIFEYGHDKGLTPLLPIFHRYRQENSFTVIVGPNGVGKSRLLAGIASETRRGLSQLRLASYADDFKRVIAISTSPFDKFPLNLKPDSGNADDNRYRYIGMRSRSIATTSSITLISAAAKELLRNQVESRNNHRLAEAFDLLGFAPVLEYVFKITGKINPQTLKVTPLQAFYFADRNIYLNEDKDLDKLFAAYNLLIERADNNTNISLTFSLHSNSIQIKEQVFNNADIMSGILLLLENQVIRLMDLKLVKNGFGEMSLRRASSGEQCIVVSMLGIAGNITDNSLILIDEPEISLHPEWQERYVQLLTTVFGQYNQCQFIIATHSPQIVANLPAENCYILALQDNALYPSTEFHGRSSDYQLAKIFRAPGSRNEYLGRVAVNLFAKISKNKFFQSNDTVALEELQSMQRYLSSSDPVSELIDSLIAMRKHYGDD